MEINNIKKIKPLFGGIVTTADKESTTNKSGIIMVNKNSGDVSLYQKVVAAAENNSRGIKVGDIVHINPIEYGKTKYHEDSIKNGVATNNYTVEFNIPTIMLDRVPHLFLHDRDIDFIVEEFE